MAMPPGADEEARRTAAHHLQVEIVQHGELDPEYGNTGMVPTRVIVRRVFRTNASIKVGDEVTFWFNVYAPPAEPYPPRSCSEEEYKREKLLEVFLDGAPPNCHAVGDVGYYSISEITDTQQVEVPTEEQVRALREAFEHPAKMTEDEARVAREEFERALRDGYWIPKRK